jgi:hypothetical protein
VRQTERPADLLGSGPCSAGTDGCAEPDRRRFAERIEAAGQALRKGKAAALAYTLGVSEQDVERLGGVTEGRDAASRSMKRDLESDDRATDRP